MRGARLLRWAGLTAGAAFGALGWGLMKFPATEAAGTVLFLFPSLIFGGRGVTDSEAVLFTTVLYAVLGFVAGWLLDRLAGSRRHETSGGAR